MKTSTAIEFPLRPLLVLGGATFVIVTGEMLPTAVLPHMSADLGVPEARTGLLVSLWAATVAVGSFPLVRLTARWERRRVVVGALAAFAASTALTAVAGTFAQALAARLLGAAACGLLWATVNAHTAALVSERLLARAVTVVIGGATLGTVLGVPAANLVARTLDWRAAFGAVAVAGVVAAAAVALVVPDPPDDAAPDDAPPGDPERPTAPPAPAGRARLHDVMALAAVIGLALVGHFAVYTFVTTVFERSASALPGGMSGLLLLFGAVSATAVLLVGWLGDARPGAALVLAIGGTAASLAAVALGAADRPTTAVVVVAAWGLASGALPPLAQTMIMRLAGRGLRSTAGAVVPVMFNLGIAAGAAVGSGVVDLWGAGALAGPAAALVAGGALGVAGVLRSTTGPRPEGPSTTRARAGMLSA